MKIGGIGVNVMDMMPAVQDVRDVQANEEAMQPAEDPFGPEYEVTISEEGRKLIGEQAAIEEAKKELDELKKQIMVTNAAYGPVRNAEDDPTMKELAEQLRQLKKRLQEQKDFQAEEGLRRLETAQKLAEMKAAQYKGEIDENNRNLVTLLRTVEEAEKAEEEREAGARAEESGGTSGTENETSDTIQDSAIDFMKVSFNREKDVEELSDMIGDAGREYLHKADEIAQNLLGKGRVIGEAIEDRSLTNEQIEEVLEGFRKEVKAGLAEASVYGSFGTQLLRDMRDAKLQRLANNPLQAMQATKDGMMEAASDAALGEARQGSIDKTSKELADEVQELIDRRNHIDRTSEEKEEPEKTE